MKDNLLLIRLVLIFKGNLLSKILVMGGAGTEKSRPLSALWVTLTWSPWGLPWLRVKPRPTSPSSSTGARATRVTSFPSMTHSV